MINPRLTALMKYHFQTGQFRNAHFRFSQAGYDRIKTLLPTPEVDPYDIWRNLGGPVGDITGIPVRISEQQSNIQWALIDNTTKQTLHEGPIDIWT